MEIDRRGKVRGANAFVAFSKKSTYRINVTTNDIKRIRGDIMSTSSTSFRTDPETLASLDAIAKDLGRSRNWILNKAAQDFIAYQNWFKENVQEGIREADNGDFATEEEVSAVFARFEK